MFHPAAGDAVLHSALWGLPLSGVNPPTTSSNSNRGSSSSSSSSSATTTTTMTTGAGSHGMPHLRADDLAVPQLRATFVGLWHTTMRMQRLSYAVPHHR
jgi:hypothetical protein